MNFEIWGLSGSLSTERDDQMADAIERLWTRLNAFDVACNRFRDDSELSRLNASPGEPIRVSETLELALEAALRAAEATEGLCDPTVLPSLLALGYDRDFDELASRVNVAAATAVRPLGPGAIHLDRERHTVIIDAPCQLDLGASAKALVVDLVADERRALGRSSGRTRRRRGRAGQRTPRTVGDRRERRTDHHGPRTSHLAATRWRCDVVDDVTYVARRRSRGQSHRRPRTGSFAHGAYATASVTASDCVLANAFATAALLWDEEATYHIAQAGWSARLVRTNGTVEFVGGWPEDTEATR